MEGASKGCVCLCVVDSQQTRMACTVPSANEKILMRNHRKIGGGIINRIRPPRLSSPCGVRVPLSMDATERSFVRSLPLEPFFPNEHLTSPHRFCVVKE